MSNNQNQEYQSLWEALHVWDSQGFIGKVKWTIYVIVVIFFLFFFLPSLLAPIYYSSDLGPAISFLLWIAIVVAIQSIGSKLKVKLETRE